MLMIILSSLISTPASISQCSSTELQLEIKYSTFTSTIEGDAIRLRNSSSTAILYCQEFGTGDFTDTICIEENTPIEVYGYDKVNQNWGEATISFRYINNTDDCGPTMDSTLLTDFVPLQGMGEMICGAPLDNDILIGSFTTPNVFCPGTEPQCPPDTIFLTTLPGDSTVIIDFLDYVTDDGELTLNYAVNAMDEPFDQIDTLTCGQVYDIVLNVTDDDGNVVSCDLVIEVECGAGACNVVLNFDGIDDRAFIESPLTQNSNFTVSLDFLWKGPGPNGSSSPLNYSRLLSFSTLETEIGINGAGELAFSNGCCPVDSEYWVNSNSVINSNTWYNITLKRDGTQNSFFLNGISISEFIGEDSIDLVGDLVLGGIWSNNGVFNFHGNIDNVRVWSTPLSDSTINSLCSSAVDEMILFMNFEEGSPNMDNTSISGPLDLIDFSQGTFFGFELEGDQSNYICDDFEIICDEMVCSNEYLYFDAINDRLLIPNQHIGNVDFTIECLFLSNNENDSGSTFHRLFTLGTSNRLELGDEQGKVILFTGNGNSSSPNIRDDKWHHIALVRSNDRILVYLDGNLIKNVHRPVIDLSALRVGYFDNNFLFETTLWKGGIDEIKLWDYALNQEEVQRSMFSSNLELQDCGLIGYWALSDGIAGANNSTVTTVLDSTQNNDGTLLGFDLVGDTSNFVCHDSIEVFYDPDGCCQISIFHSTQCNVINLNSAPLDFEDATQVTYQWTSPNTNFEATVANTVWIYDGDLNEVIICLEATDGICTSTTCDTISVSQPLPPIIEGCIENIILPYEENCSAIVDYPVPFAFDPCAMEQVDVFCERSDGLELTDPFALGTTEIICISTGITGLSDTCFTTIEVTDNIPPQCMDLTWFATLNEFGQDTFVVQFMSKPAMDECSEVFFSNPEMIVPIDCFSPPGQTFQVEDASGNTSECLINFQVSDPFVPQCVIQDQTIPATGSQDSVQVFYEYEVEDNCPNPTVTFSIPDGSNFACGSEQEIFMYVEDNYGNSDTCNFTLSVEECFDYFGSVCGSVFEDLNCNGVVDGEESGLAGIEIGLYNPVDNDLLASVITDINGDYKVDTFPAVSFVVRPFNIDGIYEVLAPAEDEYLAEIDTFETIENLDFVLSYDGPTTAIPIEEVCYQAGDTVVFSWKNNPCLPNANIMLYRSICGNEMFFSEVTGIENDGVYEYVIPADAPNQILEFALLGPGNTDFERYNCIEVHNLEIDFSFELIGCREYQFTATPNTYLSYQWTFGDGQGFMGLDNLTHAYSENGVYEVCLQARTELGCETEMCKELTIDGECDDCNITFEINELECYDIGFTVNEENYELSTNYQWTIDGQFQTEEREPFFDLGPGTYEVCLTSADAICSDQFCRTITKDTIFPELVNCLQGPVELFINENCDPVFYVPAVMEGFFCHPNDAGTPDVIYTRSDGEDASAAYSIGTTTLTASFTDFYGVSSSCSFDIVVVDDTPPVCQINTPINFQLDQNGQLTIDPSMIDNGSFDNCGEVEISIEQTTFDCSDIGQFNMTFTASDGINISTCTVEVTIEDGLAPFCTLEDVTVYIDENGNIPLDLNNYPYTATDNCGIANIEILGVDTIPCQTGPEGMTYQYGIRATDISGLTMECVANILVGDTTFIECVELTGTFEVTELGQQGFPILNISDLTDNCQVSSSSFLAPSTTCENIGINTIEVTTFDTGGNTTVCSATLTYLDRIPPSCDIADLDVQATEENGAFVTFDGFAADPCNDDIDITYSMESGALYECGEYTITMTATDEHGNFSSCDFSLIVRDCDGCCLSESAFMEDTSMEFGLDSEFNNDNCKFTLSAPPLDECQFISGVSWGDGTNSAFTIASSNKIEHLYTSNGQFELCVSYSEYNNGAECYTNTVCEKLEVFENCTFERNTFNDIYPLSIYPNPTSSQVEVHVVESTSNLSEIRLLDLSGQVIYNEKYIQETESTQLSLFDNPPGLYLLRIQLSDGRSFIEKLVKI